MSRNQSKRELWPTATGVLLLAVMAVAWGARTVADSTAPSENSPQGKLHIGVYDSRAVTVAYAASDLHNQWLRSLIAERDQAKAAGDTQRIKAIEERGQAHQVKFHNQGFGTAPVDDILAQVSDALPSVAREAGVPLIVSKWRLDYCGPDVEQVDVTDLLVAKFNPSPKTLKTIEELRKHPPLSDEELAKLSPLD